MKVLLRRSWSSSTRAFSPLMPPRARKPVGIVLADKPAGPSSFALVSALRRQTGARTGHAGTLDPFATGLLVLLSGAATSLAPCFVGLDKRYETTVDLTATSSTGDPEGELGERHDAPSPEELEVSVALLRGEVELPVPAFSAIKIDGERAYKKARRGEDVAVPMRRSHVYGLDVLGYDGAIATLRLHVSSGTYVRSIAEALGGHCVTLRRTAVGPFAISEVSERMVPASIAIGRLPEEAVERIPRELIDRVLAVEAEEYLSA
ncbi:MAG: tRNA pseudouridine(55) synthase TruB [Actinobacteria bacterium]|nr:tRNA pseudouridine(55) synthase TruB [Actinomycetota bacterium]